MVLNLHSSTSSNFMHQVFCDDISSSMSPGRVCFPRPLFHWYMPSVCWISMWFPACNPYAKANCLSSMHSSGSTLYHACDMAVAGLLNSDVWQTHGHLCTGTLCTMSCACLFSHSCHEWQARLTTSMLLTDTIPIRMSQPERSVLGPAMLWQYNPWPNITHVCHSKACKLQHGR